MDSAAATSPATDRSTSSIRRVTPARSRAALLIPIPGAGRAAGSVSASTCCSASRRACSPSCCSIASISASCSLVTPGTWPPVTGSHTRSPTSDQRVISSRVSRGDWAAAAISMWIRASARRRSLSVPAARSRPTCSRSVATSPGSARCAASRAAVPATAARWSPMSRSSCRDSWRSCPVSWAACAPASPSAGARTKEPPRRPRRVSTRPASRSAASASRSVTGETPNWLASSVSAGSRSPSSSRPSVMAWASRRATVPARPPSSSGANTVRARTVVRAGKATPAHSITAGHGQVTARNQSYIRPLTLLFL